MRTGLTALLVSLALGGAALAGQPRAVVELFTSQGCSSCTPADRILSEIAHDPGVVALSLSVDYWDYLGWKDTLSLPGCSRRQKAYAAGRGDRALYTPQAVVNGLAHVVGSDRTAIDAAIHETSQRAGVLSVPVTVGRAGGGYAVTVGAGPQRGVDGAVAGEVWLMRIESAAKIAIGRGENNGSTITYANVVRSMRKLADFTGQPLTLNLTSAEILAPGADGFVVLVQSIDKGRLGAMLGAAVEMIKPQAAGRE